MRVPIVPIGPTVQIARPERFHFSFDFATEQIGFRCGQMQTLPFVRWLLI